MRPPLSGLVAISASIMCYINLTTISRMPFARPPDIFHIKITGQPSCKVKVWGGTPDMLKEFRNSVGKPLSIRLAQQNQCCGTCGAMLVGR